VGLIAGGVGPALAADAPPASPLTAADLRRVEWEVGRDVRFDTHLELSTLVGRATLDAAEGMRLATVPVVVRVPAEFVGKKSLPLDPTHFRAEHDHVSTTPDAIGLAVNAEGTAYLWTTFDPKKGGKMLDASFPSAAIRLQLVFPVPDAWPEFTVRYGLPLGSVTAPPVSPAQAPAADDFLSSGSAPIRWSSVRWDSTVEGGVLRLEITAGSDLKPLSGVSRTRVALLACFVPDGGQGRPTATVKSRAYESTSLAMQSAITGGKMLMGFGGKFDNRRLPSGDAGTVIVLIGPEALSFESLSKEPKADVALAAFQKLGRGADLSLTGKGRLAVVLQRLESDDVRRIFEATDVSDIAEIAVDFASAKPK